MAILINTITREEVINTQELAAKSGTEDEKAFAETLASPSIGDKEAGTNVIFVVDEWRSVDEKWIADNQKTLDKYPWIKPAETVLEDNMKTAIQERRLHNFAQGLKEHVTLGDLAELPTIAKTVLDLVPYEEPKEPE